MHAPIEPFHSGFLSVGDGQDIYFETSGNPEGQAALYLHGGPGGGISGGYRRHFDPEKFLIVSFEQRGCGRSRPLAIASDAHLQTNTTQALIQDIEKLRQHLGIESWLVFGASWGTTLALAYTQAHSEKVSAMILGAVTATTAAEVEWITESMGEIFPREWDEFAAMAEARPGERIIDAYYRRIFDADPRTRMRVALAWCAWEDVHVSLDPQHKPYFKLQTPDFCLLFATLVIRYWKHSAFLGENEILQNMGKLAHIPAVLIHGRLDVSSPLSTAWKIHQAWPGSRLIVTDQGHGGQSMSQAVTDAVTFLCPK